MLFAVSTEEVTSETFGQLWIKFPLILPKVIHKFGKSYKMFCSNLAEVILTWPKFGATSATKFFKVLRLKFSSSLGQTSTCTNFGINHHHYHFYFNFTTDLQQISCLQWISCLQQIYNRSHVYMILMFTTDFDLEPMRNIIPTCCGRWFFTLLKVVGTSRHEWSE